MRDAGCRMRDAGCKKTIFFLIIEPSNSRIPYPESTNRKSTNLPPTPKGVYEIIFQLNPFT